MAKAKDPPHLGLAVIAAGAMALGLAGGLQLLGLMARIDGFIGGLFAPEGLGEPPLALDPAVLWAASAALAFALPALMLNVPGIWRRIVIWGGTAALTVAWGPVMILAAHKPQIGVAIVAVIWSGFCAIFYSANHALPVDGASPTQHE